jgi:hypothetical protein
MAISEDRETMVDQNIGRQAAGYMVNSCLGADVVKQVEEIQRGLEALLPGKLWLPPAEALHITLLDLIAPLVDYNRDKDDLYRAYGDGYEGELEQLLKHQSPIILHFNKIEASQGAVFIQATDDGSYKRIREAFLERVELLSGTKLPPQIIHSSIARYQQEVSLGDVQQAVSQMKIDARCTISNFRLVRETKIPMLEFDVIHNYQLA